MNAKPSKTRKLLLAGGAFFVSFCIAEGVLRLVTTNEYRSRSQNLVVDLRVQPRNLDYEIPRRFAIETGPSTVRFRTDSRSYIMPSYQHRTPTMTIAFLGGSTTECSIVQEQLRFPSLLSERFAKQGQHINTLNAAKSGNTLHDSLNVLTNHVVFDRPNFVVVMHAANDIGVLRSQGYASRAERLQSFADGATWFGQELSRYSYVAALARTSIRRHGGQIGKIDPRWNDPSEAASIDLSEYTRRLKAFIRTARSFEIEPIVMTQPLVGAFNEITPAWANLGLQDRVNEQIRRVCDEEQAQLIDLADEIGKRSNAESLFYDGMHVNDDGSSAFADFIVECFENR